MKCLLFIFIHTVLYSVIHGVGFGGFHFQGLKEPEWYGDSRKVVTKWIDQPLDHFNHRDNRTWKMRYFEDDIFYQQGGPVLVMLGGEWTISPGFLQSGMMYDIAKKYGGLMFYTEHRYYGSSQPTENMTSENMQYLNVDQALADVAYLIEQKKIEYNAQGSIVIAFGGSYAGNMAAWIRLKYPHLIQGSIASSAPVFAKSDYYEYYEVVTKSLQKHDQNCAASVKEAFESVEELLFKKYGPRKLKYIFNLCQIPDINDQNSISFFMNFLSEVFAGSVQYNKFVSGKSSISKLCDNMVSKHLGTPMERLATLVVKSDKCNDLNYTTYLNNMRNSSWNSPMGAGRQWTFQTCTEYGYFQTSNSVNSVFGTLFNLDFFINHCTEVYGDYYKKSVLENGIKRTNVMYGGKLPDVQNIIFVNGDVDPWHALSVLEDLNESSPAILINGSSHCQDLYSDSSDDVPDLIRARQRIRTIIGRWITESWKRTR